MNATPRPPTPLEIATARLADAERAALLARADQARAAVDEARLSDERTDLYERAARLLGVSRRTLMRSLAVTKTVTSTPAR